ncbi:hypothetical protein [Xenorhabdus szentirmaii]|nr:hypothetical protein [Xenorhabdus szentirmaii]PHM43882.1 hypothetical protein Xszus_03695 [Xenorhabdus szentirmaii]
MNSITSKHEKAVLRVNYYHGYHGCFWLGLNESLYSDFRYWNMGTN